MLAIGMITCPRIGLDVQKTIDEVRRGGFHEPIHLFCEPGTPDIEPERDLIVHHNPVRLGVLGNWAHCLRWLIKNTSADYLMVCEDDVVYCKGARATWEMHVGQASEVGFWSLYTPRRDAGLTGNHSGWMARNRGRDTWGTLAMCFPRSSAERLAAYPPLSNEDQLQGHTDYIVAECFLLAEIACYYHNPSLVDHVGRVSTIGHNWYDESLGLNFNPDFEPEPGWEAAGDKYSEQSLLKRQASSDKQPLPKTRLQFDLGGLGIGGAAKTVNLVRPADIQADITNCDEYIPDDRSVDAFTLTHTLEHVPVTQYVTFLRDLFRKLKPGGTVSIVQSDAGAVIDQWRNGELSFRSMRSVLFTPADRIRINPHHQHHNMWTAEELERDLQAVGFSTNSFDAGSWSMDMADELHDADILRDHGKRIKNLGVIGTKPLDRVPNQLHFVFGMRPDFGGKPFGIVHYLSIKSAISVNRPTRARVWYAYEPTGTWWELARELVEACPIADWSEFAGVPREHYAHRADLARLAVLREFGGIYLDLDAICVRPFGDLLQHECTLGWEDTERKQLCNAVILAAPNAAFIDKMLESQKDFRPGMWGEICITAAGTLARQFPHLLTTLDHKSFYWPSWEEAGVALLLSDTPSRFPEAICHHLWEHVMWDRGLGHLTPELIRSGKSNLCRILRNWL